jgi:hypothetical protein
MASNAAEKVQPKSPVIAMRGAGYYSANTIGAKAVIDAAADLVLEAMEGMALAGATPFAIADFGAADGGTSIDMMRKAIARIRKHAPERTITVTYTDLPHNDFSALFRLMNGLLPGYEDNPLAAQSGVLIFASGTSFYRPIFPASTISLGFSATAMHWLSKLPIQIADHTHAVGATPAEKETLRAAAKADWDTILLHRARELAPGGKLVFANFCEDEQGYYLGHTGGVNMHDTFAKHWRNLWNAGVISEAEYRRANFCQFYKTKDDFTAPFDDPNSAVSKAGLVLDKAFTRVTGCPYAADFKKKGDPDAFAASYIPTLRSWSESTFMSALDPARPAAERMAIVDRFYGAYQAEVAASPEGHGMDYVHCFMTVSKQS